VFFVLILVFLVFGFIDGHRVDQEPVADRLESVFLADAIADLGELRAVKLDDLVRFDVHQVIGGFLAVDQLVMGLFGVDEDLLEDPGLDQVLERAVDRCLRNPSRRIS